MSEIPNLIRYLTNERSKGILIWILNIGAEKNWNTVNKGIVDRNEDMIVNRVEEMNLLICREQDVLIMREMPDEVYLEKLKEFGFSIPTILVPEHDETDLLTPISELVLKDEKIQQQLLHISAEHEDVFFVPYAVTHLEEEIAAICGLRLLASPSLMNARVNDKIFNREIAEKLELDVCEGKVCSSVEEIRIEYDRLTSHELGFEKVIIKEPYGSSGKGLYIVESADKLPSLLARIARFSRNKADSQWLVEGWYTKKADINLQIYVGLDGSVDVFSIKDQLLRGTVYIGSRIPAEIDEETKNLYNEFGQSIGTYLYEIGYLGIAGIDSIITSDGTIIPVIEINGRFTLSTYISFVGNVLGHKKINTRYFRMVSNSPLHYKDICTMLDREGMLYTRDKAEGVFVYTAGTLPFRYDEAGGVYIGRIFTLIIADDWEKAEKFNAQLESFISKYS